MSDRAQRWVNMNIPYSQSQTFEGYRQDCSGYLSYIWGLQTPGKITNDFHNGHANYKITIQDLSFGDAILCLGNGVNHIVLFDQWASYGKQFYAYDQSFSRGTVHRQTPYPYWNYNYCYPIRFQYICPDEF